MTLDQATFPIPLPLEVHTEGARSLVVFVCENASSLLYLLSGGTEVAPSQDSSLVVSENPGGDR